MKNFLIITQVFSPDPAAVGQYFDEAAQAIAGTGAQVTVLTANRGYDNPKEKFAAKEACNGIQIRRLPLSSFGKAIIPLRIFAQLSFLIQCILRGLFTPHLTDLLVSTSPPMAAITAVVIGFFRPKLKVHYWVMDINPDQSIILGAFGPRHPLVLALDWLNRRILKRADSVMALDRFMAARMIAKLTEKTGDKGQRTEIRVQKAVNLSADEPPVINHPQLRNGITIIPPWPMDDYLESVPHSENLFRKEQGWEGKFVVMYSGNHSLVHPLDTILDAAEALKDDDRFVFAFIGGGKGKQAIEDQIQRLEARGQKSALNHSTTQPLNLRSLPYQPLDQIRYSLSAADLHIVSLGDNMSGIVHPCKIYGALSIGRPVLALGPNQSYLNDIIDGNDIGRSIEHGDVDATVAALQAAAEQTQEERVAIGQRAQQVATEKFSREQLVHQFLETVLKAENISQASP